MKDPGPIVKEPTAEQDRVRPVPLVAVAVGSLVAGFLIVYALGQSAAEAPSDVAPTRRPPAPPEPAAAPSDPPADAPSDPPVDAPSEPAAAPSDAPAAAPGQTAEASPDPAPAPVAPAGTADADAPPPSARGSTVGEAFYFRCWEAGRDDPAPEGSCDRLPELERRIAAQLSEIETCASGTSGTLSLGVEIQLRARQASYWAGRRTTITPVEPLIRCVRTRLEDTNLDGLEGRFRKYTLFVPIELR